MAALNFVLLERIERGQRRFSQARANAPTVAAFDARVHDVLALHAAGYLIERPIVWAYPGGARGLYRSMVVSDVTEAGKAALVRWRADRTASDPTA